MDLSTYQEAAKVFAVYPKHTAQHYVIYGLLSEAGEIAGKVKKGIRGDHKKHGEGVMQLWSDPVFVAALTHEVGDCLWYLAMICEEFGLDLNEVGKANLEKLLKRKQNGTIRGSGDNR